MIRIVSRRHEQRSIVATTKLALRCHVLDIDADSWRQKAAKKANARKSR